MLLRRTHLKQLVTLALTVAVTAVFSFRSYAALEVDREPVGEIAGLSVAQETGVLTGTGQITINGNTAQSGATVLSGSTIATGSDGNATIDLGPLGRVTLTPNTTVTLTFAPGSVNVKSQCDRTEIATARGQVDVKSPKTETIKAGEDESYGGSVEATTAGGTDFTVSCRGRKMAGVIAGTTIGPGLLGILLLIGTGAAIATGIAIGDEEGGVRPPVSPSSP